MNGVYVLYLGIVVICVLICMEAIVGSKQPVPIPEHLKGQDTPFPPPPPKKKVEMAVPSWYKSIPNDEDSMTNANRQPPANENNPLVDRFKKQINECLDEYTEKDPTCAYGAGMLHILSALRRFDGSTLPLQIAAMHTAIRQVGAERGWIVDKLK